MKSVCKMCGGDLEEPQVNMCNECTQAMMKYNKTHIKKWLIQDLVTLMGLLGVYGVILKVFIYK